MMEHTGKERKESRLPGASGAGWRKPGTVLRRLHCFLYSGGEMESLHLESESQSNGGVGLDARLEGL